ncbi:zinc finger protein 664-like [Anopheles maculipalpis]|uniref:zinc finger protein 664-like n=1 Tax=Anopheles maculipalpis TaxID=1496333 RepID=UPI002158C6C5|nr:zinc finger protein 664-like [Anopheles maculipalpis]
MSTVNETTEVQNLTILSCPECEGQLVLQQDSNDAASVENDQQYFCCNSCGTRLEIHLEDDQPKNGKEKPFQCDICNRFYATAITLKVHRLRHATGKRELCDLCGASFHTRGQLKIHRRVHTGEKPYKCNVSHIECEYTTLYLMARHIERLHNVTLDRARDKLQYAKNTTQKEKRYRCKYCDKMYVSTACLKKHILKHDQDGVLLHKCSCCDRYFKTEDETHQHEQDQHRDRFVCKICKKSFTKPNLRLRHEQYAHKSNGKDRSKYVCPQCGRKFPSRVTLSDHERAECGKAPIYQCSKCDKRYSSYSSLKIHQTVHENRLPFVCNFCGKKFRTKGQLTVHERGHTGEKPFQCDQCPRSFPYRQSLLTHMSTHTGVKRYGCTECDRKFSCVSNLQAHRRVYHKAINGGSSKVKEKP